MNDPIRIRFCPNCNTGIQEGLTVCPECGAAQGDAAPPRRPGTGESGTPPPGQDPFADLFGQGGMPTQRQLTGTMLRSFLGQNLGCLVSGLGGLFLVVLFVGLLVTEPMAVLGTLLLIVGSAGLALTAWLVRLLWDTRPKQGPKKQPPAQP